MTIACQLATNRVRVGLPVRVRMVFSGCLVVAACLLLPAGPAHAAPGDLDATFSGDGRLTTDFDGGELASDVAVQPDGRIVAAGTAGDDFAVVRYVANGTLDPTFSGDGKEMTDFTGSDEAAAIAIQADGKIVLAGHTATYEGDGLGPADFAIARYNADGTLDMTFADDGRQTTDFGGSEYGFGPDVAIQPDGRIVVVGGSNGDFAIARYLPDGTLDTTFSGDGRQTTDFGGYDDGGGVAIQTDGRIVAVGRNAGGDFALARYNGDGTLDASFSGDGKQTTDFAGGSDVAAAVALQADGGIVAVGRTHSGDDFALARYLPDGSLDATFSGDGKQTTDFGGFDSAAAVTLQPDGRIVVAGGNEDFALTRYEHDGTLDASFGKRTTDFGYNDGAGGVTLQPDGRIVAVGRTGTGGDFDGGGFAVARYDGGGEPAEPGTPPINLIAPTVAGTVTEGQTLSVTSGSWSGTVPIALTYEWRRCDAGGSACIGIAAAIATTYVLTAADAGHTIRVRETAANGYGTSSVQSPVTPVVSATAGTIAGTVRNSGTGARIAAATVACGTGYSARTASDGSYRMPNMPSGTYVCTASAKQHMPSTQTVIVRSAQTTTANFTLTHR